MSSYEVELPDLAAMESFAGRIAERLRAGDALALSGSLGTGKTTLARFILRCLGQSGEIPSPTFTIVELYEALRIPAVHADFYRLETPGELEEIGLDDYRQGAVLLAEWPERAGGFTHESGCLSVTLDFTEEGRVASVEGNSDWLERLP
ncbi:tRNA (adenosine(37)-N6)-threonylcarbamoyltransferase complex ATPase subunit type 1 TsaE [Erythrobacter sp. LQ02-29]|uniref:tRNA (adenosine(37)-N6)-threonylcarbamoyltransferase complex ATPase subunit type 1 TsaE n=1 Tax=Erythrobacter sp. LQ02-29 TaxID=2920384 RepID=UPI001F4E26F7|nr:tRNA (adenosine(37)-N6)-threonylcarbamoyltransferase complex ATPase subunit type 1 TsaE [Erythrobacter sp. LQ02-29]MCP9223465.1 tRNA (adenosine(37)-N6)-threonylcarbamoyltransferase complex ATPase subunit type 1 TsaE [Erythrobacter sp. LQ02-29]